VFPAVLTQYIFLLSLVIEYFKGMVKQERITEQQNGRKLAAESSSTPSLCQGAFVCPVSPSKLEGDRDGPYGQCKTTYNILLVAWVAPHVTSCVKSSIYMLFHSILEWLLLAYPC